MIKKLKLLYLDSNVSFINPTRNIASHLFAYDHDVIFYGPGYTSCEILKRGLSDFVSKFGPFDIVIATEHIAFIQLALSNDHHKRYELIYKGYRKNYVKKFPDEHLSYILEMFETFRSLSILKCTTFFESDYYNFTNDHIQILEDCGGYYIGWNDQFVQPVSELTNLDKESFGLHANDNWYNFVCKYKDRIVSLPAFINEAEFSFLPIAARSYKWSVMGTNYWARKEARRALEVGGVSCAGKNLARAIAFLCYFKLPLFSNHVLQKNINHIFREIIESSMYSYTCGSGLAFPVRKFFEIPALGSVLVCQPCNGFEALGFKDGVNAFSCAPTDILLIHKLLDESPAMAQSIASAGREMVWKKHSTHARSKQISAVLRAMMSDSFVGSYWENGEFFIRMKDKSGKGQPTIQIHTELAAEVNMQGDVSESTTAVMHRCDSNYGTSSPTKG